MRWTIRAAVLVHVGGLGLAHHANAQAVRGTVSDRETGAPLSGVVVTLLDDAGVGRSRSLTNELGEYRVIAPAPGAYRLRTLRIGFRPATSEVLTLGAGVELSHAVALSSIPLALDTMRVVSQSSCDRGSDIQGTLNLWEQVRAALAATQLSEGSRVNDARLITYERTLDPSRDRVLQQRVFVKSGPTRRPWVASPIDSLRNSGYVVTHLDGSTSYHAPDLTVLLSDAFIADHCFRVVGGQDASQIGVAFEPNPARRHIPGIAGTLWLDRRTSELRDMDFRYVNTSRGQSLGKPGGSMRFVRMRSGAWLISGWSIRMPQTATRQERVRPDLPADAVTFLRGIRVEGGELVMVTQRNDTLWARPPIILHGRVVDSASGRPVASASVALRGTELSGHTNAAGDFSIADALPGEYVVEVTTPELEQIGVTYPRTFVFADSSSRLTIQLPDARSAARRVCPDTSGALIAGLVRGTEAGTGLPNVLVTAAWNDANDSSTAKWVEVRTNHRGRYTLCGVSPGALVTLRVLSDSGGAPPRTLSVSSGQRMAAADFVVDRDAREAMFTGTVVSTTNAQPMGSVEVVLDSLQRSAFTNDRGRFVMDGVPPGTHRVTVRRVGYEAVTAQVTFAAARRVDRQFALSAVATLATVDVQSNAGIPSFEARRSLGLGHFLTRAELAKFPGKPLHMVLNTLPGANVLRGAGTGTTIVSGRVRPTGGQVTAMQPKNAACNGDEPSLRGMPCACYPQVYAGNSLVNPGSPTPPANINEWITDRVEAVEWYSSPINTPAQYYSKQAECGVLVIHLRQYAPKDKR